MYVSVPLPAALLLLASLTLTPPQTAAVMSIEVQQRNIKLPPDDDYTRLKLQCEFVRDDMNREKCKAPNFRVDSGCYYLSDEHDLLSWDDAVDACRKHGGVLAEPHNPIHVITHIRKYITQDRFFLGWTDRGIEGHWIGASGRAFIPAKLWNLGDPNSFRGDEDCVSSRSDKLSDERCKRKSRFLCEM